MEFSVGDGPDGHTDHADINAAKNILALGHSVTVCGGASVGGLVQNTKPRRAPMKQKPISA
jgi:transposase